MVMIISWVHDDDYYYKWKDYSDAIARTLQGHVTIVTDDVISILIALLAVGLHVEHRSVLNHIVKMILFFSCQELVYPSFALYTIREKIFVPYTL